MDSSKIRKTISSITFSGKWTTIKFGQSFQPKDQNEVIQETPTFKSNMSRHPDFERAMDRFKVHLITRSMPFVKPDDKNGKLIDKKYFDEHLFEDDPRFMDVVVTGIIITTKKDMSGFQILGTTSTVDDQIVKLKSPVISLLRSDGGYNYPLLMLADEHLETLKLEALEYLNYKSNSQQLKLAV
jgi:hypothetical protein